MSQSMPLSYFFIMWTFLISLLTILVLYPKINILIMLIFLTLFSLTIALNLTMCSTWSLMSFLTFLMMTGGIMVLFTFFISLISNHLLVKKSVILYYLISSISLLIFFYLFKTNMIKTFMFISNLNLEFLNIINQFNLKSFSNLNFIFLPPNNTLIISLMIYLLFSLIFITKISTLNFKSLRMKKLYE